jgi:peptidoglycan/LPS O-acetylase OafA/YrhL
MVLEILFWLLLVLCAIGEFVPESASPLVGRLRRTTGFAALVLIGILGYFLFGNPIHR